MPDDSLDQLIRDAYAIAARPERLLKLLQVLQAPARDDEDALQPHFANVIALLDEIDPNAGGDFSRYLPDPDDSDSQPTPPDLSLDQNLHPLQWDATLFSQADLVIGEPMPDWMLDIDRQARTQLRALANADGTLLLRLNLHPDGERAMVFTAKASAEQQRVIHLRAMRLRWDDKSGAAFAQSLNLTQTEAQLAQHLVNGGSVNDFARQRGRAIGTARNQLKALLKKLSIGSQTELISLYAGFHGAFLHSQLGIHNPEPAEAQSTGSGDQLTLPDGNILPYELYGNPGAMPVLYLHATIDGAYLTPRQQQAASDQGLRIIAPWLPFYAGSKMDCHGLAAVDAFVDRLLCLLDHLNIERCCIVTARVAAPYGMAALQRDPQRFCGLVMAGAVLPADDDNDFSHLAWGYRAPLRLARVAPSFVRLYFAAAATMMRRGKGMKFFESIYGNSPADLATLRRPDVIALLQRSMERTFEDGYESTAQQALLTASDWSHYCRELKAPVTVFCGKEDGLAPPDMLERFCQRHGFTFIGPLDNVGSLTIQQIPEKIFAEAAKILN